MVQDIEDGLDQAMIQAWQNTAQSLRQLHGQLRQDIRQSMRERRATMDRERSTRAEQRRMLADWEKQNRQRLNNGFEQTCAPPCSTRPSSTSRVPRTRTCSNRGP